MPPHYIYKKIFTFKAYSPFMQRPLVVNLEVCWFIKLAPVVGQWFANLLHNPQVVASNPSVGR